MSQEAAYKLCTYKAKLLIDLCIYVGNSSCYNYFI